LSTRREVPRRCELRIGHRGRNATAISRHSFDTSSARASSRAGRVWRIGFLSGGTGIAGSEPQAVPSGPAGTWRMSRTTGRRPSPNMSGLG
jgi:hypothetical protein